MAQKFVNPANGHQEEVNGYSSLLVLLFGGLYLIAKGLWTHVLIWLVTAVGLSIAIGVPIPAFVVGIIYAFLIQGILEAKYLREGWKTLEDWEYEQSHPATFIQSNKDALTSEKSVPDELRKLAKLRDEGILSNEEFQAQKAKLLA